MGNGYFFADMCELYDYCKENVIKEAKAKFGKETVAEDISSVNVNILLYKKWKIFLYNYRCYASAS